MTKFKVGDIVKRVTESYWPKGYGYVGIEYEVLSVAKGGYIKVIKDSFHSDGENFELVRRPVENNDWELYTYDMGPLEGYGDILYNSKLDGKPTVCLNTDLSKYSSIILFKLKFSRPVLFYFSVDPNLGKFTGASSQTMRDATHAVLDDMTVVEL